MKCILFKLTNIPCAALAAALTIAGGEMGASFGAGAIQTVSQKGRAFQPLSLSISRNDTVLIVNDDGDLLHHAYIESDTFNFDSGDQTPGSKTPVVFTVAGDFKILCAIHPKMKLQVHVD